MICNHGFLSLYALQIQSSEELAQVFEYEFDAYWKPKSLLDAFGNGATSLTVAQSRLQILNQASEHKMFKFVTHRNSQVSAVLEL